MAESASTSPVAAGSPQQQQQQQQPQQQQQQSSSPATIVVAAASPPAAAATQQQQQQSQTSQNNSQPSDISSSQLTASPPITGTETLNCPPRRQQQLAAIYVEKQSRTRATCELFLQRNLIAARAGKCIIAESQPDRASFSSTIFGFCARLYVRCTRRATRDRINTYTQRQRIDVSLLHCSAHAAACYRALQNEFFGSIARLKSSEIHPPPRASKEKTHTTVLCSACKPLYNTRYISLCGPPLHYVRIYILRAYISYTCTHTFAATMYVCKCSVYVYSAEIAMEIDGGALSLVTSRHSWRSSAPLLPAALVHDSM
ncbi:unnamed protein product [Trichogramma brassicae]|uniref:Uncharacterized protein n=1 Tax=Trichogramma brassicae TaxID=86971 RepID=A0A6H5ISI5_9HYME|nr:unnamed protein product [Trichogramma brassicae]